MLALVAATALVPVQDPAPAPPNIVILYADDMGWGDLAIQNPDAKVPTPNLDRLAREGMRFTDAHSSSGICTPSRYALLTGRHHWRKFHGIVDSFGAPVIDAERLTLAGMLRAQGYRTACIGKWHLGWDWAAIRRPGAEPRRVDGRNLGYAPDAFAWTEPVPGGPLARGFDHYFGDDVPNFPPYAWIEDDRLLAAPTVDYAPDPEPAEGAHEGRPGPMVEGWRLDAVMPRLTEHAVQWIEAHAGGEQPFFLYFPWTSPHAPIVPSAEFAGSTAAGGYGDYLAESDWCAGQVLDALDRCGVAERTIVVFSSDNGPEHYAYPRVRRFGHRSAGPLRGLKRDVFEGGHRVPMVVRWPGQVAAGAVSDALVSQVDLMATLAAVVGFELPDDAAEDSFDLLPLWRGEVEAVRTFHVHNTFAGRWAIRSGHHVLIDGPDGYHTRVPPWFIEAEGFAPGSGDAVLFDLSADLGQRRDLAGEQPQWVTELRALLRQVRERGHSAPRLRN